MVMECKSGKMAQSMRELGSVTWRMATAGSIQQKATHMKVIGSTIKPMEWANLQGQMAQSIRDTGLMINSTANAKRLGQMEPNSKVYSIRVCERAMVQCFLRMEASIGATLSIMKFKVKVLTYGPMGEFMKETLKMIKCMAREH